MSSIKRADLDILLGDCECTNSGAPEHRSDSFQCPELTYVNMDTGTIASNKGSNDIPIQMYVQDKDLYNTSAQDADMIT